MKITVRVFGELKEILGGRQNLELDDDATVSALVNRLAERAGLKRQGYFGDYKVGGGDIAIILNGKNVELLEGLKTALRDGDEVVFLIPTSGG